MKDIITIISIIISVILGVYLFFAIIAPLAFSSGSVIWYKANSWSCSQKGGEYIQITNVNLDSYSYRFWDCIKK